MSLLAWAVAGSGVAMSSLAAAADGALLSRSKERSADGAAQADNGTDRERDHRTFAFVRVIGHMAAGCGVAAALDLSTKATLTAVAWLVLAGLITVVVAESTARVVGASLREPAATRVYSLAALVFGKPLRPVSRLGDWVDGLFATYAPEEDDSHERREEAAAQFREVVSTEADVSGNERELLLSIFDFGETTAEEVMVPRVDIFSINRETPWSEMLDRVRSAQHSRVPVYEESVDEIVGILYVKDLLPCVLSDAEPEGGWPTLVREPVFIPASKRIADLLKEFRQAHRHIAIVADEYGGTAGLVTIEDVLEELVGEIRDEYDNEEKLVDNEENERYWVSGRLTLDDLSDELGYDFERDDVSTVGGLILELLGRVPRSGETLVIGPFRVIVERVSRRKIERVYFQRLHDEDSEASLKPETSR